MAAQFATFEGALTAIGTLESAVPPWPNCPDPPYPQAYNLPFPAKARLWKPPAAILIQFVTPAGRVTRCGMEALVAPPLPNKPKLASPQAYAFPSLPRARL